MNTEPLMIVGGTDISEYIEEDELSVRYIPVYDERSVFTAIDGSVNRTVTGYKAIVTVILEDIPSDVMSALRGLLNAEKTELYIYGQIPEETEAAVTSAEFQPVCTYAETELWNASVCFETDVLFRDGL